MEKYVREYIETSIEPEDSMIQCIKNYLNHYVEPEYKHLTYQKDYYIREKYDYHTANRIIEDYRTDLEDKLIRLNEFQFLINKNSFPDNFKEYLFTLMTTNRDLVYSMMNKNCKEPRKNNSDYLMSEWTPCNINNNYCTFNHYICDNCQFYINVINEYSSYKSHYYLTGNEEDASYTYRIKIDPDNNIFYSKTLIIQHTSTINDIYAETFHFLEYYFEIRKNITKIDKKYLSGYYIATYQCDISESNNFYVWNTIKGHPVEYYTTKLVKPDEYLKKYSEQLYNKYKEYYDTHI